MATRKTAHIFEPFPPDWRLELEGPVSRWYPSCRIYRQQKDGSWDATFARLREELAGGA